MDPTQNHHIIIKFLSVFQEKTFLSPPFILFYPTLSYLSIFSVILSYNILRGDNMKPLKEKISITIDNDILAKLKEKAEYDDRSLSQYINIVLKQHLKDKEDIKKP